MKHIQTFESFINESKTTTVSLTSTAAASIKKELKSNNIKYTEIKPTVLEIEDTPKGRMAIQLAKERFGMQSVIVKENILSEERTYGLFNDAQGKPSKLSQEILDFCQKGLPKDVVNNISEVEAAGYFKTNMITPPTVSNKGQSRGEADYTSIYIHFTNPMGKNKIKGMTVGLRKRTSGPGTGYVAISLDGVPGGTFASEFFNKPEDALEKLWNENVKPLL